ncbi:hypothetical protein HHK36_024727 [Tetracentron sinense]|uniref:ZF-HD dimerization-type domain-containing protein n=1 Tax=Tetracentron sinense TaxID=13715 RepID=A0A834YLM2_TETSI|nr:hypothetical protein HHK36_024727 [Tetracentron sinense]
MAFNIRQEFPVAPLPEWDLSLIEGMVLRNSNLGWPIFMVPRAKLTLGQASAATVRLTPETEIETPPQAQPIKPLSFTNGAIKRHHDHTIPAVVVFYRECLKNHAASLGGHALDGCGEFMPSPSTTPTDPTSLKCAACGCHRNFHHREPEGIHVVKYPPHHHQRGPSPNSPSPPPLSASYYPSAPHMLLALSAGLPDNQAATTVTTTAPNSNGRKRFRTKFSKEQKEKMYMFSERVGWKMQKRDEGLVEEFCKEVGIRKGVLKVWMHNNKNTFGKRDVESSRSSLDTNNHFIINNNHHDDSSAHLATNGSSSSS